MRYPRFLALAIALPILIPGAAAAYPISPKPLWSLVADADLIAVAEVVEVRSLPRDDESWDSAAAHLRVIETLKGPRKRALEVPYAATMMCPAPARYALGETVVAFLARAAGAWRTVSLSYGTLYPRGDELEDMTTMVRAALVIQRTESTSSGLERRKQEWLVQAAVLPGTRWHGLYELAPSTDTIRSYYDRSGRPGRLRVTEQQQELLARAMVGAPKFDPTLAMMLGVLDGFEDETVDAFAVGALEALLDREEPSWWVQDAMWQVLGRYGDPDARSRLEHLGAHCWDVTADQLRTIWSEAKVELAIPEAQKLEIDVDEYIPVGGRTPS